MAKEDKLAHQGMPPSLNEYCWNTASFQPSYQHPSLWTAMSPNNQISPLGGQPTAGHDNSYMTAVQYSVPSSCDESLASGTTDYESTDKDGSWDEWEQRSHSAGLVPKTEPIDEDNAIMSTLGDTTMVANDGHTSTQKRPRGRPRKNPAPAPSSAAKVAKGRSKTGCITCRRRKKKCDETKPTCMFVTGHQYLLLLTMRIRPQL